MDTTDVHQPPGSGSDDAISPTRAGSRQLRLVAHDDDLTPADTPESRTDRDIERLAVALGVLWPVPHIIPRPMAAGARKGRTAR